MSRKRFSLPVLIALLPLLILALVGASSVPWPPDPGALAPAAETTAVPSTWHLAEVESAIRQALDQNREAALVTILYETGIENTRLSADGQWGRAHLVPLDPESGEFVTSEPGLALTLRQPDGSWQAILPSDGRWEQAIQDAPQDLISVEEKTVWLQMYATATAEVNGGEPFSGYYLPWAKGVTIGLSRSITHYEYPNDPVNTLRPDGDMFYSFDFYYPALWYDHALRMFDLHASRPGVVWLWRDIVPNCYDYTCTDDPDHESLGNYIVIKDESTDPDTYQLYLHLAQDSIPAALKVKGTPVGQGQFIGKVDNTGQSWGHHLHFQVHTNQWSYWGHAQDILFNEVTINGGRPRTLYEASHYPEWGSQGQSLYTSQNPPPGDGVPPVGDILAPQTGQVYSDTLYLQGWAIDDDPGLQSAQFLAFYQGFWWPVGPEFTTILFEYTWDWCAAGVPDGPVSLALRLVDKGGVRTVDLPGLRHVLKAGSCQPQPPACQPAAGQAAIFAEPNYAGACQLFATGIYTDTYSFGAVGNDNAAALLLGPGTAVTLYSDANLQGRSESFQQSDPNLAENRIGSDTLSSIQVFAASDLPLSPAPQWPAPGASFTTSTSLDLLGMDLGAGRQFRLELTGPDPSTVMTTIWAPAPFWSLGNLLAGSYSWRLQASNPAGESAWSAARSFTVSSDPATPPAAVDAPFNDNLEGDTSDWATSGSWAISTSEKLSGSQSFRYSYPAVQSGQAHFGDLTSRPINLPAAATPYYLTFWYRYETESFYPHWDQRRVQVSLDGQPFQDIYQLVYDPDMNESGLWMQAVIDLSPYYDPASAHQLRLRFHFHSLDGTAEGFRGWYLDDINLSASAPLVCSDAQEPNDSPAGATPLSYGDSVQAQICPQGDYDFYTFDGQAGERIGVNVDAKSIGSSLDSILYLLDADG
ncbi:MAG: peptidoglycan DD-metalloendopeptidase family protein, partial [Anaerolineales bacterium]|nr:peptidoglycan DD-metalloendopeptidase family protein [Anaerolineales bacterium]